MRLTPNAVRNQLAKLLDSNLVVRSGIRPGTSKPSIVYAITIEGEAQFSTIYLPVLTHFLRVAESKCQEKQLGEFMEETGRSLAGRYRKATGNLNARARAGARLLGTFGALPKVSKQRRALVIRSAGCPLAALTSDNPAACRILEGFLSDYVRASAKGAAWPPVLTTTSRHRTVNPMRVRTIPLLVLASLTACTTVLSSSRTTARPEASPRVRVQMWLTTGDSTNLLAPRPDLYFSRDSSPRDTSSATIYVDDRKTYQQMLGFGAAMTDASAHLIRQMTAPRRDALLGDLFGRNGANAGIGLSFLRVPMGASDFSMREYSYDDMAPGQSDSTLRNFSIDVDRAEKIPLLRNALAINPETTVMASPWSPPGWMKSTRSLIKGTLLPKYYDSFADYFVRFIRAYDSASVPIYAITLQNEPNFEPDNYPGMSLPAAARARVIADHMGPRFASEGIHTLIWDWDHNWDTPQSPLEVLADSGARKYVQGVAWHCYNGDVSAQSQVRDAHPNKDVYFSECSGGEWSPRFAENLKWFAANLIIGATRNWARAVALWNLALDEKYGPHLGGCGNCRGVVTIDSRTGDYTRNIEYYVLGHASKFVRSGAYRIASENPDTTLRSVAFRNASRGDSSRVLIVLNSGNRARAVRVSSGGESFRVEMPAVSLATFRWDGL
jgi:glucosylceramidase